ncbi:serine hydrolase domain-containing protein [Maribellus sediminis]|uniref:serine hydrolase domain-containing protein n=1 Tax=Maribellus sediminis TaxID=2696285 RepID=UPI0014320FD9|nr:serine hydrolase domain-containing protein [Maribellus sediminis]
MRRNFQFVLLLLLLFGLSNCKKANTDIQYDKKYIEPIKSARKKVAFHMAQNSIPGANVAVSIDGKLVYSEGIGWASKDLEVPAKRSTKFRIGELSSLFTNVLYQKLVEEGALVPDSSVQFYYPDFPEKRGKVTISQLANETSGIRPPRGDEELKHVSTSLQQGIKLFKDDPLEMPPGEFQNPSCFNYNLLGAIMEKTTGEKFYKLLNKYVIDTLGFENTVPDNPFITIANRSNFFEPNIIAQVVNASFYDLRMNEPSKGLLSNAEDLVKLGNTFLTGDYFSEETRENLFEPLKLYNDNISRMVNGWIIFKDNFGNTVYGLEGTAPGGSASVLIFPEHKMVIGYACNLSSSVRDTPAFMIANAFLGTEEETGQGKSKLQQ